jgi:hypothetical protein
VCYVYYHNVVNRGLNHLLLPHDCAVLTGVFFVYVQVSKQQAEASMKEAKRDSSAAGDGQQQAGTSQAGAAGGSGVVPMDATPSGTAPPPAATTPSAVRAPPAAAAGGVDAALEEKVQRLVGLGFPRDQCLQALRETGGNEEHAAAVLFGDF